MIPPYNQYMAESLFSLVSFFAVVIRVLKKNSERKERHVTKPLMKKCNYSPPYFIWIKVLFYGSLLFFFIGKNYNILCRIISGHIEL